jgi:hypothetical protein
LKLSKFTLAAHAAMNSKVLRGATLVLAGCQANAAVINVSGTCTLVRPSVAANNATTAIGHCGKGLSLDRIVLPPDSAQTLTADTDMGLVYRGIHVATVLS